LAGGGDGGDAEPVALVGGQAADGAAAFRADERQFPIRLGRFGDGGDLDDERFRPAHTGPTEIDLAGEIPARRQHGAREKPSALPSVHESIPLFKSDTHFVPGAAASADGKKDTEIGEMLKIPCGGDLGTLGHTA
jgi:hypothetical protein